MRTKTLILTLSLAASAPALAQSNAAQPAPAPVSTPASAAQSAASQPAGTISQIEVNGTTDLLADFVRAVLTVQPGAPVAGLDAASVRQEVLNSGYFAEANVYVEQRGLSDVLVIDVTPNATIGNVDATGLTFLSAEGFKKSVADLLNIAPGAALNTARLEQARDALLDNYRSEGYPFVPSVEVQTVEQGDGTVTVRFLVDETAPLSAVRVRGVTLVDRSEIEDIFRPLQKGGKFTPESYYRAVAQVQALYEEAGYLYAGVDVAKTTLDGGLLTVQVVEGKVAGLDTSNLGGVSSDLTGTLRTKAGGPIRAADLQADVRTLSNATGKPVGFALQAVPGQPGAVAVYFGSAGVVTAPIQSIVIAGNTLLPENELREALTIQTGDVFSPQLAQENFAKIRDLYREQGYEISTRDAVNFDGSTLTLNVREVKLAGYELKWQGEHETEDRVILRELPAVGGAFNAQDIRAGLGRISRLGYVQLVGQETRVDPENPEDVTFVLTVAENETGSARGLGLGLGYNTLDGWSGDVKFEKSNILGLGHILDLGVSARQNDAGENWSGNVGYTIPWLDLDFLDFRENRTSLSVNLSSDAVGNQTIYRFHENQTVGGGLEDRQDTGRDYTVRSNAFGVNLGRSINPNLRVSAGVGLTQRTPKLETIRDDDERRPFKIENGKEYWYTCEGQLREGVEVGSELAEELRRPCASDAAAKDLMPDKSLTTNLSGRVNYDDTNSFTFPTDGWRASVNGKYSFGRIGEDPVSWFEVETGASTYFGIGEEQELDTGEKRTRQVLALRANAGTVFGTAPEGTGFKVGGGGAYDPSRQLRGVDNGELFGTSYFTSSAEYRYDTGLNLGPAQGVYAIAFADAGTVWDENEDFDLKSGLNYGVGAGLQVDVGFGGQVQFPLRFDYGYSPQREAGQFYFRLGQLW